MLFFTQTKGVTKTQVESNITWIHLASFQKAGRQRSSNEELWRNHVDNKVCHYVRSSH